MIALSLTLLAVVVSDQALKLLLRRVVGSDAVSLGPFGSIQVIEGRLWMRRLRGDSSRLMMWTFWLAAASALVMASTWVPSSAVFVGLLLGGSLSNVVESSQRGTVSDYVCLRFWPAFNLADLALTAGAIGTLTLLLIAVRGTAS